MSGQSITFESIFKSLQDQIDAYEAHFYKAKLEISLTQGGQVFDSIAIPDGFVSFVNWFGAPPNADSLGYAPGQFSGALANVIGNIDDALKKLDKVKSNLTIAMGSYRIISANITIGNSSYAQVLAMAGQSSNQGVINAGTSLQTWYDNYIDPSNISLFDAQKPFQADELSSYYTNLIRNMMSKIALFSPNLPVIGQYGVELPGTSTFTADDFGDLFDIKNTIITWGGAMTQVGSVAAFAANGNYFKNKNFVLDRRSATAVTVNSEDYCFRYIEKAGCSLFDLDLKIQGNAPAVTTDWAQFRVALYDENGVLQDTTVWRNFSNVQIQLTASVVMKTDWELRIEMKALTTNPTANILVTFSGSCKRKQCEDGLIVNTLFYTDVNFKRQSVVVQSTWSSMFSRAQNIQGNTFNTYISTLWTSTDTAIMMFIWSILLKRNPTFFTKYGGYLGLTSQSSIMKNIVNVYNWFMNTSNVTVQYQVWYTEVLNDMQTLSAEFDSTTLLSSLPVTVDLG